MVGLLVVREKRQNGHHLEEVVIAVEARMWDDRVMTACLIAYVGINTVMDMDGK